MSDQAIKRPSIPSASGVTDWESLRRFLAPVKTLLDIHEGSLGRPGKDRFVPEWELGQYAKASTLDLPTILSNDTTGPAPPTNFVVTAGSYVNILSWVNPVDEDLDAIQIWVNTSNSVTEAVLVATVTVPRSQRGLAMQWTHYPENLFVDHYYWIRSIDYSGNYSTWVPPTSQGGYLVEGKDTVGQTIAEAMRILNKYQPLAPVYDPAVRYHSGDIVRYPGVNDGLFQCYFDNSGAGVTGVAPPLVAGDPGATYWMVVGILVQGYVDGLPTVGINGNLLVDGSVMARSIYTDYLSSIKADLGTITAGSIVIGEGNKIWFNDGGDGAIHVGGSVKADAAFQVSPAGILTIRGAIVQSPGGSTSPIGCFRGAYNASETYYLGETVTSSGSVWMFISAAPASGVTPATGAYWQLYSPTGAGVELIFRRTTTTSAPSTPATAQSDGYVPTNWTAYQVGVSPTYIIEWVARRTKGPDGVWSSFSSPAQWSRYAADGVDGVDGKSIEFIFKRTTTTSSPATPATSQTDDYVPSGWTDDQLGVDLANICEWVSKRTKTAGVWSAFSGPSLWARYAYDGDPGDPGATGDTGPGLTFMGAWNSSDTYVSTSILRHVVLTGGVYYQCLITHSNKAPASYPAYWASMGASFASVATGILLAGDVTIYKKMTFTGSASAINVTGASGLTINSAGGLVVNSSAGITLESSGGIKVNSGGDIVLMGDDDSPAELILKDGDGGVYTSFYSGYSGNVCFIAPSGDNNVELWMGGADLGPGGVTGNKFKYINLHAYTGMSCTHTYSSAVKTLWWAGNALYHIGTCTLGKSDQRWASLFLSGGISLSSYSSMLTADSGVSKMWAYGSGADSAMFVIGGSGSATQISPHNFSMFEPDEAYFSPWSYYNRNDFLGRAINVDMYGAIAEIEKMSGKKFIYTEEYDPADWAAHYQPEIDKRNAEIADWEALPSIEKSKKSKPEAMVMPEMPKYMKTILDKKNKEKVK